MFTIFKSRKFIVVAILLVVVFFGYRWWQGRSKNGLEMSEIKRGSLEQQLVLSGEVAAREQVKLAFQTAGNLYWVGVKVGEVVKEGQLLAKLDQYKLQQDLIRAEFDYREAQVTVERVYDDVRGHDKDETFEQREDRTTAEVARDKAYYAVQKIKKDLRDANLLSPVSGIVIQVANADAGVNISPAQNQFEIVNPDTIYFKVSADQTDVTKLVADQPVKIVLDAFEDEEISGKVTRISFAPETGETGTVYAVDVDFQMSNPDWQYRLGMTGDAEFVTAKKDDVFYVPIQYLKVNGEGSYLLTNEGKNKLFVQTGLETDELVEVSGEGVTEGVKIYHD